MTDSFTDATNAMVGMVPTIVAAKVVSDMTEPRERRQRVVKIKRQERKGRHEIKETKREERDEHKMHTRYMVREIRDGKQKQIHKFENYNAADAAAHTLMKNGANVQLFDTDTIKPRLLYEGMGRKLSNVSLAPLTDIKLVKMHDDGDMTLKKGGKLFVKTTDGRTFQEVPASRLGKMHKTKHGGLTRRRGIR
jgi:hypothetical protein